MIKKKILQLPQITLAQEIEISQMQNINKITMWMTNFDSQKLKRTILMTLLHSILYGLLNQGISYKQIHNYPYT